MITPAGYKHISLLPRAHCCFAVFLLSAFDLRSYIALSPTSMLARGANDGWFQQRSESVLIQYVDALVRSGFLEYGPAVRGWGGGETVATVRIVQKFILTNKTIRGTTRRLKQRAERTALVPQLTNDVM
jgi:hypothetical protein